MFALAVKGGFTIKCPFYEEKGERIRIGLFGIVLQMNGGSLRQKRGEGLKMVFDRTPEPIASEKEHCDAVWRPISAVITIKPVSFLFQN